MAVETAPYINSLNVAWPDGAVDPKSDGDNHLRLIKNAIKNTFPNITGAVTPTQTNLNALTGLSGSVTSTQLNFLTGLTANVQTSLDAKAALAGAIFTGNVGTRSASGNTPTVYFYNQVNGGALLFADTAGKMWIGQAGTTGSFEKHFIVGTRDGGVELAYNGVKTLETGALGVSVTGGIAATAFASVGTSLSVGTDIAALGEISALGNVTSALGNVVDVRGQVKSYRTAVTQNLSGTGYAFSSIPTDAIMIKIVFADASFNAGSQDMGLLLSNATSYNGKTIAIDSGGGINGPTWNTYNRIVLTSTMAASQQVGGSITLTKIDSTTWLVEALTGPWGTTNGPTSTVIGSVSVSAFPDTVTIGSLSGVGVFDSGYATMYVYR